MTSSKEPEKWPALVGFPFTIAAVVLIGLAVHFHLEYKQAVQKWEEYPDLQYQEVGKVKAMSDEAGLYVEKMKKGKRRNWCGIGGILLLVLGGIALNKWNQQRLSDVGRVKNMVLNRDVSGLLGAMDGNDRDVANAAEDALVEMGDLAMDTLMERLVSSNVGKRYNAGKVVARIGDRRAIEPLIKAIELDRKHGEQSSAVDVLAELGGDEALEALIEAARDESWEWQAAGIRALGELGDERAIEVLAQIPMPEKGRDDFAAEALEKIGTPKALKEREERLMSGASSMKTASGGVPGGKSMYWRCPKCEQVLEKNAGMAMIYGDILGGGSTLSGSVRCGGCGAAYSPSDVYGGKYDVNKGP